MTPSPLYSLCCGARPLGETRATSTGLHTGYCALCREHCAFVDGPLDRMRLPTVADMLLAIGSARAKGRVGRPSGAIAPIVVALILIAIGLGLLVWGAQGAQGGVKGVVEMCNVRSDLHAVMMPHALTEGQMQ